MSDGTLEERAAHVAQMRRSEFPATALPNIITPAGNVSRNAVVSHLSARGIPNASPEVVAVLIRHGGLDINVALVIAGLVENAATLGVCTWEDRVADLTRYLRHQHATKFPQGKYAALAKAEG